MNRAIPDLCYADNTIRWWDFQIGTAIGKSFSGKKDWVTSITMKKDEQECCLELVITRYGYVESIAAIGKLLHGNKGSVLNVAISEEGKWFSIFRQGRICCRLEPYPEVFGAVPVCSLNMCFVMMTLRRLRKI